MAEHARLDATDRNVTAWGSVVVNRVAELVRK